MSEKQPEIIILPEPKPEEWDTDHPKHKEGTRVIPRPENEEKLDDDIIEFLKTK